MEPPSNINRFEILSLFYALPYILGIENKLDKKESFEND
jgi:hypothetical protein